MFAQLGDVLLLVGLIGVPTSRTQSSTCAQGLAISATQIHQQHGLKFMRFSIKDTLQAWAIDDLVTHFLVPRPSKLVIPLFTMARLVCVCLELIVLGPSQVRVVRVHSEFLVVVRPSI